MQSVLTAHSTQVSFEVWFVYIPMLVWAARTVGCRDPPAWISGYIAEHGLHAFNGLFYSFV